MTDPDAHPDAEDFVNTQERDIDWDDLQATAVVRVAEATRDFCLFMQTLFVPRQSVKLAPEHGWPDINKEAFARLEKSDKVIEVLQSMSYIEYLDDSCYYQSLPDVVLADYRNPSMIQTIKTGDIQVVKWNLEVYDTYPPYVVSLVYGEPEPSRDQVVLDCRYGIVYWVGRSPEESSTREMYPEETDDSDFWSAAAWRVEDFFEMIKERFKGMELLPENEREVLSLHNDDDNIFEDLKEIYKNHGWPNEYQKDECIEAVKNFAWQKKLKKLGRS